MPIKKTKAVDAKFQKGMVGFYNAVKSNNELVQKFLEIGLSLQSIEVFGLKRLDFDREFHEANPDLNLSMSTKGGNFSGGGGTPDMPFLTVEELQRLFSVITGTRAAADTQQFHIFLTNLQTRTTTIEGRVAQVTPVLENFTLPVPSQLREAFAGIISDLTQTRGILNLYNPNGRQDETKTPPARFREPGQIDIANPDGITLTTTRQIKDIINRALFMESSATERDTKKKDTYIQFIIIAIINILQQHKCKIISSMLLTEQGIIPRIEIIDNPQMPPAISQSSI